MALVATDGRFLRVNRSLCEIVGYSEEELRSRSFQDLTHPDDLRKDLEQVRRLLAGKIRNYQLEKRYLHKEGHAVWILLGVSLVHDEEGGPLYFIAQVQDISGRKRAEEQLQRQAFHDALTGLPSRKLFMDRLGRALERTRRRRGLKVAVLFMDLDGFKNVNDSLGHETGDLLLTVVAQRLERILRPEDTLARFGGDEFVVLLEEVEGPEEAVLVAERIGEELGRPFVLEGRGLFASASVGIGLGDARTKTPEYLLRDADTAMYRAKEEQARYRVFDPAMYERAKRRLELENELRRAIEQGEFVVRYQPIVDLQTDEVWGVEALVRWEHPERGLLDPSEFMVVVEEGGLIVPLGERVLEEACRQAKRWQEDSRIPPLVVSVNLSAGQLRLPDLPLVIGNSLRKTGFDARRLSLDITETAYIRALEKKTATFDRLKGLGVSISIDDFGVGYSSLSYLKRLPADALKIDKSFVRGVGEDAEDTAIVRMVIDLAHTLGMKVVAEGVEGWAQGALLAEMGCDMAQGFHFARPLPPEEMAEFLAR
jgi:diguanylate cyclase (GGDEF)-like protein/PAS domain S-box-containing protein